jgi:hypothetical protein
MLKSRLLQLLLLPFRKRNLRRRRNLELITKLGRDQGGNEDLRMGKPRMVKTKSENEGIGMAMTENNDDPNDETKTDNLATPELAEKPKKRKVVLVPATGAKLTKTSKKLLPTKSKKPPPKMLKVKMPKLLPLKKIPSQLNLKFNI